MKVKFFLCLLSAATLILNCKSDDEDEVIPPQQEAFTYSAISGFSTGTTSVAGTSSPTGYT